MQTIPISKQCISCGKTIKGRSDKKFCDDYCRNEYNNRLRAADQVHMRGIQQYLRKNRNILRALLPDPFNEIQVSREQLLVLGFRFDYMTHIRTSPGGTFLFCCYEYSFREMEIHQYLIARTPG